MNARCIKRCEDGQWCTEALQLGPQLAVGGFQAVCPQHGDIGRFVFESRREVQPARSIYRPAYEGAGINDDPAAALRAIMD